MQTHAKSFTLASWFFKPEVFEAATKIYHWCRHCDDSIDEAVSDPAPILDGLFQSTRSIFEGGSQLETPFFVMKEVVDRYHIPSFYLFELLEGMKMDIVKNRYSNLKELELYCFRVAGTVGLMMTHVMGLFHVRSLPLAVELGHAMQMTNIARDVKEDYERGRIYLPQDWMQMSEVDEDHFLAEPQKVYEVVHKLLLNAEMHYRSAEKGLIDLPFRCAWAVAVALELYRDIGRKILSKGAIALESRIIVSKLRKLLLVAKASLKMLLSIPKRLFNHAKPIQLNVVYSPEKSRQGP